MNPEKEKKQTSQVEVFRLSPQQEHLWAALPAQGGPFRVQALISIEGKCDTEVLQNALVHVIEKHEILRTTFVYLPESRINGQVVHEFLAPLLETHNLIELSDEKQNAEIDRFFLEAANRSFNFEHGPLLHISLLRLSERTTILLITQPALCSDSVSIANLVQEISHSYAACMLNQELPGETMQYADIAEWQYDILESDDGLTGRKFWKKQDASNGLGLELPFEKQHSEANRFKPQTLSSVIERDIEQKLQSFIRQHNISTDAFLLTVWQILLWQLTGQKEMIIGVANDGREYEEIEEVLGLFEKNLPLCCHLEAINRFSGLSVQTRDKLGEIDKWQGSFSWEKITNSIDNPAETDFFPVCFAFKDQLQPDTTGDICFAILRQLDCVKRFNLKLAGIQHHDKLEISFHYDASLFQKTDIQRLVNQLSTLIARILTHPDVIISELPILCESEYHRLVLDFNDTRAEYPRDKCIHHLIEEQAQRTPNNLAVVFEDQQLSYSELNSRANQLANHLRTLGVGPNILVALCIDRSLEMIIGILGILKAGGVYVPLDPTYPRERLNFILEDTGAQVLLTRQQIGKKLFGSQSSVTQELRVLYLDADWENVAKRSESLQVSDVRPQDLVYVIYTSGSTGTPKGVVVTHQNLVCSDSSRTDFYTEPVDRFLLLSSIAFDSSVVGIFWTLTQGGTLVLIDEETQKDPNYLAEQIIKHRISHLLTLPSFYGLILARLNTPQFDTLRTVIVAGEPCPKTLIDRHKELLTDTALYSEYGATETTVFSSVCDCLVQKLNIAPIGDPISNAQMYLLNSSLQPVPVGVLGEVYFGGDGLAQGYLNRPELTAERFIPNPFSKEPGARLYQSGDLARHRADGDIEFIGRTDEQVKIRGYRIELGEVEATCSQHPAVLEVVVVAKSLGELPADPDQPDGKDLERATGSGLEVVPDAKRLVAYVVATMQQAPTINELRQFLLKKMPGFMVPSVFVFLEALPRTPNGKVDRRALPAPSSARPELGQTYVAPHTEVEKGLSKIWAEVLGLGRVGSHDNFFELGGDSILSIQIVSRANQAGFGITPRQIFEHQNIAELSRVAGSTRTIIAEQNTVEGFSPLTPIQHWFFELDPPAPHHWNISLMLKVHRSLSADLLERAGQKLLEHHDALRMRFSPGSDQQQASTDTGETAPVDIVDLSSLEAAIQEATLEKKASESQAKLNIEKGPAMRFVLFDLGQGQPLRLLWVLHHLVADVVSWRILLEDLQTAVQQIKQDEDIQLPPKTSSFKLWSERLKDHAQSVKLQDELSYWLSEPRKHAPALPTDFPESLYTNTVKSESTVTIGLGKEETRQLLQEVPAVYNTQINDVLLTALVQSFFQLTGSRSLFIDLEGHGREDIWEDVDLSRTVGWFTTSFPVLLQMEETADLLENLRLIKEQLRSIPGNGIGYGLLRYLNETSGIVERLSTLPQPQINFNYLGQLDQIQQDSSFFSLTSETSGIERDPMGKRPHLLEIVGSVIGGSLRLDWSYSKNIFERTTIETLAEYFMQALHSLINRCQSTDLRKYTPSDFEEFQWDQDELDNIMDAIRRSKEDA